MFPACIPAARRAVPVLALLLPLCGCELLRTAGWWPAADGRASTDEVRRTYLPPIPPPRDAFEVEIVFVERPVGDPLLGAELWNELPQAGEIPPASRALLEENGFRLGTCGSSPPRALQEMLSRALNDVLVLTAERPDAAIPTTLRSHRLTLQSGGETEIQTSPVYPRCAISIAAAGGVRVRDYEQARCMFRVRAERVQDGWVRLEFVPEVHHGALKPRHVAGSGGFALRSTQKIDPLTAQRFAVTLNLGEMVVLSADPARPDSAGRHFFVGASEDAPMQRLVVLRLADMKRADPVYAE
ncbi:MAG: hypothetical protein WD069_10670 [Planctomycetales bacterium]